MEIDDLVARYPRLYHMAESGTWLTIKKHGLLSTKEIIRRAGIIGLEAARLLSEHRPEKVPVNVPNLGTILLRDQKPMDMERLKQALVDGTTPSQWYELINSRVFFWVQEHRLLRLLKAKHYKNLEHDVLTLDTKSLLQAHAERVWLCPMNSGNTFPIPHHRGRNTFQRISQYPTKKNGAPIKEIVELTVDNQVADIANYVLEVRRMRADVVLERSLMTRD